MKKLFAAASLALAFSVGAAVVPENPNFILQSISIAQAEETEEITAMGMGAVPAGLPAPQAKMMARRAAIMDAQRNLIDIIKGTNVDAESTMNNFILQSDVVKTKVNGMITGARVIKEGMEDGGYVVTMSVPKYGVGSVAETAITQKLEAEGIAVPAPLPEPAPQAVKNYVPEQQAAVGAGYTGIVIDAKGSGLETTFCPVIYDSNGRSIYGVHNVDKDYAIMNGVVEYADGSERWQQVGLGQSRAGNNPLIIKIVSLRERAVNKCDVVISVEDADKILIENQRSGMLSKYAVVFEK